MSNIVTRFAPSPSGDLHLGGARTALFNYLFARSQNGKFLLRIENTDRSRISDESTKSIINSLNWLGINFDEQVVYQYENILKHKEIANILLKKGFAYKCFLKKEEIEELKNKSKNKKLKSIWRNRKNNFPKNEMFVIRIKIPENEKIIINDLTQGKVVVHSSEIDDYVLIRANGDPTFLLSSVVDDIQMNVSHIIRGDDHLTNSFRQSFIFKFLNEKIPIMSHIPLILNEDGKKLSKRNEVSSIEDFKKNGYLKEAMINYMLRLGWSYKDKEFFKLAEAIKLFDIKNIGKSPSKINKKKLNFLNTHYLKTLDKKYIFNELINFITQKGYILNDKHKSIIFKLLNSFIERSTTFNEIYNESKFVFCEKSIEFSSEEKKILSEFKPFLPELLIKLKEINNWDEPSIQEVIKKFIDKIKKNYKFIGQPLRLMLTYQKNSLSLSKLIDALGKNEVIKRLTYK